MNMQLQSIGTHLSSSINRNHLKVQMLSDENQHNRVLTDKQQSVSSNREKLGNKFFTASFGDRTKRSTPPSTQQVNEAEVLSRHEDLIHLNPIVTQKPICLRAQNGAPNPPVPDGYANWEAFIASEGQGNHSIVNPRQELAEILSTAAINFTLREELITAAAYRNHFSDFERKLNSDADNRESAIFQFEQFQQKIDNAYLRVLSKKQLLFNAIIQKMAEALREVKFGASNRWIEGQCWSFTSDEQLWNQKWKEEYLPKALRAISNESNTDLEYVFTARRLDYLNKGLHALRNQTQTKGWQPYSVAGAEYLPLPTTPSIQPNAART